MHVIPLERENLNDGDFATEALNLATIGEERSKIGG